MTASSPAAPDGAASSAPRRKLRKTATPLRSSTPLSLLSPAGTCSTPRRPWVLDGSFLRDPAFAGLVAALRPDQQTLTAPESYGIAAGAALLCRPPETVPIDLIPAHPLALPGLTDYAAHWRTLAGDRP